MKCAAFPNDIGIPLEITMKSFDHREPHPDDNGIQFEMVEDDKAFGGFLRMLNSPEHAREMAETNLEWQGRMRELGISLPPPTDLDPYIRLEHLAALRHLIGIRRLGTHTATYIPAKLIELFIHQIADEIEHQTETAYPNPDEALSIISELNEVQSTPQKRQPHYIKQRQQYWQLPFDEPIHPLNIAICNACVHFDTNYSTQKDIPATRCTAFPNGIPVEILRGNYDHRFPHPDDNGVQFEMVNDTDELGPLFNNDSITMEVATTWIEGMVDIMDALRRVGFVLPPDEEDPKQRLAKLIDACQFVIPPESMSPDNGRPYFPSALLRKLIFDATQNHLDSDTV